MRRAGRSVRVWTASTCLAPLPSEPVRTKVSRRRVVASAVAVLLVLGGTQAAWAFERGRSAHLMPSTQIGGIGVGGMHADAAVAALRAALEQPLRAPLDVTGGGASFETTLWNAGLRVDVRRAVEAALDEQQSTDPIRRLWRRLTGGGRSFALRPVVDPVAVRDFLARAAAKIDRPRQELEVKLVDGFLKMRPARSGRKLDRAKAFGPVVEALRARASSVALPVRVSKPEGDGVNTAILVRTGENRLYYYRDGKLAKTYRVATGMPRYATPTGSFRIVAKRKNPTWGNPGQPWSAGMPRFIGPGPGNPLGTRALNLSASGIRIHGTYDAGSIGSNASHGCIRMRIAESEELFEKVSVGTPVVIVRA